MLCISLYQEGTVNLNFALAIVLHLVWTWSCHFNGNKFRISLPHVRGIMSLGTFMRCKVCMGHCVFFSSTQVYTFSRVYLTGNFYIPKVKFSCHIDPSNATNKDDPVLIFHGTITWKDDNQQSIQWLNQLHSWTLELSGPPTSEIVGLGGWSPRVMGYQRHRWEMLFKGKNHIMTDLDLVPNSFQWCVLA